MKVYSLPEFVFVHFKGDVPTRSKIGGKLGYTLFMLVRHQKTGITPIDALQWRSMRLAAEIHLLRGERYRLEILTRHEPHDGGFHARYFLITPVHVLDVSTDE